MDHDEFPRITGHRGVKGREPENTLRSFLRAQAEGADEVELDVHLARSGELVVIHDETLERTTNGAGLVAEHDFEALRRLDAGEGEQLPTLVEVIDALEIRVQVEVKAVAAATAIAEIAGTRPDWVERIVLSSFHPEVLEEFRAKVPHFRRGLITHDLTPAHLDTCRAVDATIIYPGWSGVDSTSVAAAHAAGVDVVVWLVNDEAQWRDALAAGVDGVSSDLPGDIVALRALADAPVRR